MSIQLRAHVYPVLAKALPTAAGGLEAAQVNPPGWAHCTKVQYHRLGAVRPGAVKFPWLFCWVLHHVPCWCLKLRSRFLARIRFHTPLFQSAELPVPRRVTETALRLCGLCTWCQSARCCHQRLPAESPTCRSCGKATPSRARNGSSGFKLLLSAAFEVDCLQVVPDWADVYNDTIPATTHIPHYSDRLAWQVVDLMWL